VNRPPHARAAVVATLIALVAAIAVEASPYRVFWDGQEHSCLPYTAYLVDVGQSQPHRNDLYAFRIHGLEPHFKDGTMFLKRVVAVPGDKIDESNGVLRVNGVPQAWLNPSTLAKLHATPKDFVRHTEVPTGNYLLLGSARDSYDGRYWGFVTQPQLYGRAHPLW